MNNNINIILIIRICEDYIYINWSPENQRVPNVSRIAVVAQQQSNSCIKLGTKYPLTLIS